MSKPVPVTFLKPWRGYSAGEVAGFDKDVATKLKDNGVAETYEKGRARTRPAQTGVPASSVSTDTPESTAPPVAAAAAARSDDNDTRKP
jgi:hypothetical protein